MLSELEVEQPIIIALKYPDDVMPEMFESPLIIRDDLLETILDFGVDNVDSYDCHLVNQETGKV